MNTALYMLRALQVGVSVRDLEFVEVGDIFDMMTESANDGYKYRQRATQEDFDRMFG